MNERHHVESVVDGVAVSQLLIAAISLVFRRAKNGDLEIADPILPLQPRFKRRILRRVINYQHFDLPPVQLRRDAVQDALNGFLGVVGDDENEDTFSGESVGIGGNSQNNAGCAIDVNAVRSSDCLLGIENSLFFLKNPIRSDRKDLIRRGLRRLHIQHSLIQ